jgi:uncharacterized coiled-coil protein SlyX
VSRADLGVAPTASTTPSSEHPGNELGTTEADQVTGEAQSLVEAQRRIYDLSARVRELETTIRRREYSDAIRDLEERAVARDLDIKAGYLRHLETAVGELNDHIVAVETDRSAIIAHLGHLEAQLAGMQGQSQDQRSYRVFLRMMALLRRTGPLYRVLRYLFRVAMRCLRGLRRIARRGRQ